MTSILGEAILGDMILAEVDSSTSFDLTVSDSLTLSETLIDNAAFARTNTDNLTLTETISLDRTINLSLTDTLSFSESFAFTASVSVDDTLALVEDIDVTLAYGRTVADNVHFVETIGLAKSKSYAVEDVVAFVENPHTSRSHNLDVTDMLSFSEHIAGEVTFKSLTDAIVFTETRHVSRVKHLSLSDHVTISDIIARRSTLNLDIEDTLVFADGIQKPVNVGGTDTVFVPDIQVIKLTSKCKVILQGVDLTIILPCPEFGDSESGMGEQKIIVSKTGIRRIYKQSSNKYRLKYDFVVTSKKAYELKNFVMNYNNREFKMTNWKGEVWLVKFTTNPFTFTEAGFWGSSCNKFTIPLEFEGTRLN